MKQISEELWVFSLGERLTLVLFSEIKSFSCGFDKDSNSLTEKYQICAYKYQKSTNTVHPNASIC